MTEPLSPSARAILNGFRAVPTLMDGPSIAGALRAAADQVVPEPLTQRSPCREQYIIGGAAKRIRAELLAIATELEGVND
jgi:hypothetical protein